MVLVVARRQGKCCNVGACIEIDCLGEVALVPEEGHSVGNGSATFDLGRLPILLGLCSVLGAEESDASVRYVIRVGDSEYVYLA